MIVPITSDLAGYAAFWTFWVKAIGLAALVWGGAVIALLYLIWRK